MLYLTIRIHKSSILSVATFALLPRVTSSFLHWRMKEFSVERVTLRVDVIGPENMPFAGTSVQRSARKVYRLGQSKG